MFPLGVLLLVSGSWLNSGEFGMEAVASQPYPGLTVEEGKEQKMILHSCALIGWILGFLMILNAFYSMWTFIALRSLIFAERPWARESWNQGRLAANQFLSKVREESVEDQFFRMTESQQKSMAMHDEQATKENASKIDNNKV